MKPSSLLFNIVKSLIPEEEGYFKQLASLQQGEKNYLKIYSHLQKQNEYDEEKVKHHFKDEQFVKHFPSEKNQLLHHVLRGLRNHRNDNNTEAYINEDIKNIQILFNKSLYRLARRELNKIKTLAYKHELFYSLLEIIDLEKVVIDIEVRFDESDMNVLNDLMIEKNEILSKLSNLHVYENILSELTDQYNKYSLVRSQVDLTKIEDFLGNEKLTNSNNALSKKALITLNLCKTVCYRLLHQNNELLEVSSLTIKLFEQDEAIISEKPMYYILCYSFLARAYTLNNQLNECFTCLDKIRSLQISHIFKPTILQIAIFTRSVINDSMFYLYTGQFDKHQKIIPYILKGMKKYEDKIPKEELSTLNFILFMSHFGSANYSGALVWMNNLLNAPEKEVRPDLLRICKIVNLVLHYELQNTSLLAYLFKANQRFYDSNTEVYAFEKTFMKYFRKIALLNKKEGDVKHFEKMKDELNFAFKDPYQKFALEYFDFEVWITSKLHQISYKEAIQISRALSSF
jgi:hypothetical protein